MSKYQAPEDYGKKDPAKLILDGFLTTGRLEQTTPIETIRKLPIWENNFSSLLNFIFLISL